MPEVAPTTLFVAADILEWEVQWKAASTSQAGLLEMIRAHAATFTDEDLTDYTQYELCGVIENALEDDESTIVTFTIELPEGK